MPGGVGHKQQDPRGGGQAETGPHQSKESLERCERNAGREAEKSKVDCRTEPDQRAQPERVEKKDERVPIEYPPFPYPRGEAALFDLG